MTPQQPPEPGCGCSTPDAMERSTDVSIHGRPSGVAARVTAPEPSVSFELYPPKTDATRAALPDTLVRLAEARPDFFSVTYGASGSTRHITHDVVRWILTNTGTDVVAHLTCIGLPSAHWQVPYHPSEDGDDAGDDIQALLAKQEAGADYAITQVFFEVSSYTRYLAAARAAGVTIPLLPGIVPLTDPKRLRRLEEISGVPVPPEILQRLDAATDLEEQRVVGTAMGVDLVHQVLAAGAPGLHIYTFDQHTAPLDLLEGAHLDDRGHLGPDVAGGPQVTAPLFTKG